MCSNYTSPENGYIRLMRWLILTWFVLISFSCTKDYYHVTKSELLTVKDSLRLAKHDWSESDSIFVLVFDGLAVGNKSRLILSNGLSKFRSKFILRNKSEFTFKLKDSLNIGTFENYEETSKWQFVKLRPSNISIPRIMEHQFDSSFSVHFKYDSSFTSFEIEPFNTFESGILTVSFDSVQLYGVYKIDLSNQSDIICLNGMNRVYLSNPEISNISLFYDKKGNLFFPDYGSTSFNHNSYLTEQEFREVKNRLIGRWSVTSLEGPLPDYLSEKIKVTQFEIDHDLNLSGLNKSIYRNPGTNNEYWFFNGSLKISPSGNYLILHHPKRNVDNVMKYTLAEDSLTLELFSAANRSLLKLKRKD